MAILGATKSGSNSIVFYKTEKIAFVGKPESGIEVTSCGSLQGLSLIHLNRSVKTCGIFFGVNSPRLPFGCIVD